MSEIDLPPLGIEAPEIKGCEAEAVILDESDFIPKCEHCNHTMINMGDTFWCNNYDSCPQWDKFARIMAAPA